MTRNTLVLLWLFIHFSSCSEYSILIDKYREEFVKTEDELWVYWKNYKSYKFVNQEVTSLMQKMASFEKQNLNKLPQNICYGVEPLRGIKKFMDLQNELLLINTTYDKFKRHRDKCLDQNNPICQFDGLIDDVTNVQSGVKAVMSRVQDILYEGEDCISDELNRFTSAKSFVCENVPQSAQQLYYNFYNLLSLSQLKAYILLQITNLIKLLVNKHNKIPVVIDSLHARQMYKEWVRTIFDRLLTRDLLTRKSREIVKCDPNGFIEGVNYDQFTRLLQGHIEYQADMSKDSSCRGTCKDYYLASSYQCYEGNSEYCQKVPRCSGILRNCFDVESPATICVSKNRERRYEFVTYESGKTLGPKGHCSEERTVNAGLSWYVPCNYCMCLCDESGGKSDRYISMQQSLSDIKENMVVTGIRFKKINRILHLQIQEGKLLPYSRIDPSTVRWVEVNDFRITDHDIFAGTDYIVLDYESRNLALDNIDVGKNRVVTGVYFNKYKDMIQLNVRSHRFNSHTGSIIMSSVRISNIVDNRIKINIIQPDVPVKAKSRSTIHTEPNRFVQFTNTDLDKDAAQTTVPFIDLQDVVTVPPVPVSGVGIVYRGNPGFGGFIAPKIETYDYVILKRTIPDKPTISYQFGDDENP